MDIYCQFIFEVNNSDEFPLKDENGEILLEEPLYDYVPTIIIDDNIEKSMKIFKDLYKPNELIYYFTGGPDDLVKELSLRIIKDGNVDLEEAVNYVNYQRMYSNYHVK